MWSLSGSPLQKQGKSREKAKWKEWAKIIKGIERATVIDPVVKKVCCSMGGGSWNLVHKSKWIQDLHVPILSEHSDNTVTGSSGKCSLIYKCVYIYILILFFSFKSEVEKPLIKSSMFGEKKKKNNKPLFNVWQHQKTQVFFLQRSWLKLFLYQIYRYVWIFINLLTRVVKVFQAKPESLDMICQG